MGWAKGSFKSPPGLGQPLGPHQVLAHRGPQGGSLLRDPRTPCPVLWPPPHLQTQGEATVSLSGTTRSSGPSGAPGWGRGGEPEPKGGGPNGTGRAALAAGDNFQVPWSSPPIGRLARREGIATRRAEEGGWSGFGSPGCQRFLLLRLGGAEVPWRLGCWLLCGSSRAGSPPPAAGLQGPEARVSLASGCGPAAWGPGKHDPAPCFRMLVFPGEPLYGLRAEHPQISLASSRANCLQDIFNSMSSGQCTSSLPPPAPVTGGP